MNDNDAYEEAMAWLNKSYTLALAKDDVGEMLTLEWIMDKLYFDNDMRNS